MLPFDTAAILFVALLGAVIGSFLNVVIFRLPRGISVRSPRRSFCPFCQAPVNAAQNIPILSWLALRGRCRTCDHEIPMRYPVVETVTAIAFVSVWDQLFVAASVPSMQGFSADWPIALAYLTLFACLLACSAMDIESYMVDIRLCCLAMAAGIVGHALRGLPESVTRAADAAAAQTPSAVLPPALALIGTAMGLAWLLTYLVRLPAAMHADTEEAPHDMEVPSALPRSEAPPDSQAAMPPESSGEVTCLPRSGSRFPEFVAVLLLTSTLAALVAWLLVSPSKPSTAITPGALRLAIAAVIFFLVLVLCAWSKRPIDDMVFQEIQQTRRTARAAVLREFAWLLPAVVTGLAVLFLLRRRDMVGAAWPTALEQVHMSSGVAGALAAAMCAVASMTFAAALGWAVRILGTLAFGKEAFGTGDIYILAAIGAVAGIWHCVFGFFIASLLALAGVAVTLLSRTHRAIPFGPWLALGSFCTLAAEGTLLRFFHQVGLITWGLLAGRPSWELGR